jgi:hypothetical protein
LEGELKPTLDFSRWPVGTKAPFLTDIGIEQIEAVAGMYKFDRVQAILYRTEPLKALQMLTDESRAMPQIQLCQTQKTRNAYI